MTRTAQEDAKGYAGFDKTLSDLQAKLRGYEASSVKMRIAHETGIPYEFADSLSGETEEEIRANAKGPAGFFGAAKPALAPLKSTELPNVGGKNAALRAVTEQLPIKEINHYAQTYFPKDLCFPRK